MNEVGHEVREIGLVAPACRLGAAAFLTLAFAATLVGWPRRSPEDVGAMLILLGIAGCLFLRFRIARLALGLFLVALILLRPYLTGVGLIDQNVRRIAESRHPERDVDWPDTGRFARIEAESFVYRFGAWEPSP